MFNKYLDLLKSLFENIFNKGQNVITLQDYFMTLFYSFSILLIVLLGIALLYIVFLLPKVIYKKLIKNNLIKVNELVEKCKNTLEDNELKTIREQINNLNKKISKLKISYFAFIVFVYVPIVFPLILIVLDMILNKVG